MRTTPPTLLPLFRSEFQARLLTLLVESPDRWWRANELRELLGGAASTLHAELNRLGQAGLVEREEIGRVHRFRIATDSLLYRPLRELIEASIGVEAQLREELGSLPGVEAAAIFGSWAEGRPDPASDIDVLVVGEVDFRKLTQVARKVEERSGRDVQLLTLTRSELRERLRRGSGLLKTISSRPIAPLIGNISDLMVAG
jgi:predicted nucleotidyltransferase